MTDKSYFMFTAGQNPFLSARDIARAFGKTDSWARKIRDEIRRCERYKSTWVTINDDGDAYLNLYVLIDYLKYRGALKEKNISRQLPPYDAAVVRKVLGEYRAPILMGEENENEGFKEVAGKLQQRA